MVLQAKGALVQLVDEASQYRMKGRTMGARSSATTPVDTLSTEDTLGSDTEPDRLHVRLRWRRKPKEPSSSWWTRRVIDSDEGSDHGHMQQCHRTS